MTLMTRPPAASHVSLSSLSVVVAQGLKGVAARRGAIGARVREACAPVDRAAVTHAGGTGLAVLRRLAKDAAVSLRTLEEKRASKLGWCARLPRLARLLERLLVPGLGEARAAAARTARAHGAARAALKAKIAKKLQRAAAEEAREPLSRLAELERRLSAIGKAIGEARAEGRALIPNSGLSPLSQEWMTWIETALAEAPSPLYLTPEAEAPPAVRVSVINNGEDHSHLDLSPRSRVAAINRTPPGLSASPWIGRPRDERSFLAPANRLPGSLAGFRLNGRPPVEAPGHLLAPRERSGVPILPGSYMKAERMYLPVALSDIEEARAAGASVGKRLGCHVDLRTADLAGPLTRFLPFVAQRFYAPLPVEMIPSTSWGASLANLLTSACWRAIRTKVTERYGGLCQICGQLKNGTHIECHEIWDYDLEAQSGSFRIQRLAGMLSVCKACHGMHHLGFSAWRGHGDQAAYRLGDVNGWSMGELEEYMDWMQACWEVRSRRPWLLDLSIVSRFGPLTVDSSKWRISEHGFLERRKEDGERSITGILGAAWRIGSKGEIHAATPPPTG